MEALMARKKTKPVTATLNPGWKVAAARIGVSDINTTIVGEAHTAIPELGVEIGDWIVLENDDHEHPNGILSRYLEAVGVAAIASHPSIKLTPLTAKSLGKSLRPSLRLVP
jgi:hypothetical protein